MLAGLLLELAAEHLLPAVLAEIGAVVARRASRAALGPHRGAAQRRPPGSRAHLRPVPAAAPRSDEAEVLSDVPGRLRVRVADLRGNPARATRVEHALAAVPGVVRIQTNPITGSVLVEYDPALAPADRVYATLTGRRRLCLAS